MCSVAVAPWVQPPLAHNVMYSKTLFQVDSYVAVPVQKFHGSGAAAPSILALGSLAIEPWRSIQHRREPQRC